MTADDPWVRHELTSLIVASEQASTTRRRSARKWAAGGIAAVLVLGGATAAVAATIEPWGSVVKLANLSYETTLSSGNTCETRLIIISNSVGSGTDSDLPSTVRADTAKAKALAAQIDVSTLDIDAARDFLVDHDMIGSAESEDDIEVFAYHQAVTTELERLMKDAGVNPDSIAMRSEVHCAEDL